MLYDKCCRQEAAEVLVLYLCASNYKKTLHITNILMQFLHS